MPGRLRVSGEEGDAGGWRRVYNEAQALQETAGEQEFSRLKLSQGGDLRKYYPLSEAARPEYDAWRQSR